MPDRAATHIVSVSVEDGALYARCQCGWFHRWRPFSDTPWGHYGSILGCGMEHTLAYSDPLPARTDDA